MWGGEPVSSGGSHLRNLGREQLLVQLCARGHVAVICLLARPCVGLPASTHQRQGVHQNAQIRLRVNLTHSQETIRHRLLCAVKTDTWRKREQIDKFAGNIFGIPGKGRGDRVDLLDPNEYNFFG